MWLVCSFGREQCEVKHLCGVGNIMHFEPMEIYVRDLVDILAVGLGQYDIGDACTLCRQDLLFDSPIGSTLPRRVSSPVMATRGLGRRLMRADTIDVAMVMLKPKGPSLGMAPSGTWICTARSVSASEAIPRLSAWLLTCCRAMEADSFITSPSLPVRVSFSPFDGDSDVST